MSTTDRPRAKHLYSVTFRLGESLYNTIAEGRETDDAVATARKQTPRCFRKDSVVVAAGRVPRSGA